VIDILTVLTLYVLSTEGMALIAVAKRHLSGSILVCWFVAAKPSTYCKCCLYSLSVFAVPLRWINVIYIYIYIYYKWKFMKNFLWSHLFLISWLFQLWFYHIYLWSDWALKLIAATKPDAIFTDTVSASQQLKASNVNLDEEASVAAADSSISVDEPT